MNILVLAPLHVEYSNFRRALEELKATKSTIHKYKVVECGVGKANAAATTITEISGKDYNLVVVIGYAAGSSEYETGQLIIPSNTKYHDTFIVPGIADELLKTYELQGSDDATILTGDCFVNKELADKLMEVHGENIIFDMESTAVAQICEDQGLDVLVLKLLSDIPQLEHNETTFLEFVEKNPDFSAFLYYLEMLKD